MKKYIKSILVIFCVVLVILSMTYNTKDYIEDKSWKYYSGFSSGDIIKFEEVGEEKLKMNGRETARIVFCFKSLLIIKNHDNGRLGYYTLKTGFE